MQHNTAEPCQQQTSLNLAALILAQQVAENNQEQGHITLSSSGESTKLLYVEPS